VGEAGYLLGDKEEDWRTKVDELMESEALRKELGRKAYERSKQFTWERAANSLEEALGTIMRR
jgi:glycosyltransferase involved in cell wall biosynthesis